MSHWAGRYIGIPYVDGGRGHDGCDCWGLVWLVYREQFEVDLPSYRGTYVSAADKADVARLLDGGRSGWRAVSLDQVECGDVALLRYSDGTPAHVGVMLDQRRMLHVHEGIDTTIAHLDRRTPVRWRDRLDMIGRYLG